MQWAYERSKFHRKLYEDAGLKPGDIKSYEDIVKGPQGGKGNDERYPEKGSLPLRGCPLCSTGRGHRISTDQRNDRDTCLSARYLAGLGVVV